MPIQITSTTSLKHTVVGGVLEEWKALVQRESQTAYRLTGVEVEADRTACPLALWREKIVEWWYKIIDNR